jgi:6-phospho-3-hexuloisomerase
MRQEEWSDWATRASRELTGALQGVAPDEIDRMADELLAAKRIVCVGSGREGLMMRTLCMRLMHHGLDAHMAGDMTTPPVGPDDLVIVSVWPGSSSVLEAIMDRVRTAGAKVLAVTAQPDGPTPRAADVVIHLPAQTMANDADGGASMLPMGTAFEWLELTFFDFVALHFRERTGQSFDDVRARHTNVE